MRKLMLICAMAAAMTRPAAALEFQANLTRVSQDLYEAQGHNLHIRTRFCHEHVVLSQSVVRIDAIIGSTLGEITFTSNGGKRCVIEELIR